MTSGFRTVFGCIQSITLIKAGACQVWKYGSVGVGEDFFPLPYPHTPTLPYNTGLNSTEKCSNFKYASTRLAFLGCCLLGILTSCARVEAPPSGDTDPLSASALVFTEVTESAGFSDFRHVTGASGNRWFPESMGSGGGFVDYNGDGWEDILLMGGGNWPEYAEEEQAPVNALRLYRNDGDGTFTDVTATVGLEVQAYGIGVSAADIDNDGDADIFLTTLGENLLFLNHPGSGPGQEPTFTEVGRQAGVAGGVVWSSSAIFFDADRDGYVDLYVGNYVDWSPENDLVCMLEGQIRSYCTPDMYKGVPASFYHNNGDGTFSDWTEQAGFLPAPGKTLGVAEYDVNRDGWPDLFVASDTQRDLFYMNQGDGTFREQGALGGMAYDENGQARAGMGIDIGVVDHSGEPTLFVGNFSKEMIAAFRYDGNGLFVDRAALSQIGRSSLVTLTFGLFLFDVDLDGDLDLFAANGHVQPEIERTQEGIGYAEVPHLYINQGDGVFEDVAPQAGALEQPFVARGAAYADYDRDGDLDVLITENGSAAHLFRNDQQGGRSVRVFLEGRTSNRDGLSARIIAQVGKQRMERFIRTGSSYLSVSEKAATFGLGEATQIDSLIVYWPSGQIDRHVGLKAGVEVFVVEGADTLSVRPRDEAGKLAVRYGEN